MHEGTSFLLIEILEVLAISTSYHAFEGASEVYTGPSRKRYCVEKEEEAEALPSSYRIA